MAFLENCWYAAAWDDEIGESPLARRILDRPVVLFRGEDGRAAALADRCIHRHAPLSHGRVEDGGIRCGYHGLLFAKDGTCIEVPGQTRVPPGARVESYPVVERDRFVGEKEMMERHALPVLQAIIRDHRERQLAASEALLNIGKDTAIADNQFGAQTPIGYDY